jgi:hypothetical protein
VAEEGVEPSCLSARDFESRASAIPPLGHITTVFYQIWTMA